MKKRLVVGISGSSGAILGIRLLEALRNSAIETHLVITPAARLTIEQETPYRTADVLALASQHYAPHDIGAAIASGSFETLGMVVIPCSIKSLSAIANSYSDDLLVRAADVTLKEGRPLLLVVRETPLHRGHLRLMDLAARAGAILFPPVPAFYAHPRSLDEMIDATVGRVLRRMGIENHLYSPWQGIAKDRSTPAPAPEASAPLSGPFVDSDVWDTPVMTLATSAPDGAPHAAAVYFAATADRRSLYFFSKADSQHSLDIEHSPRAAVTIHPIAADWMQIRGLQLRGQVTAVPPGPEWERAWQVYLQKFPFVNDLETIVAQNHLYCFRPTWARKMDNRDGFGAQEEWSEA